MISLRAGGVRHTIGKALEESYNFVVDLISIKSLHTKLWEPKIAKVPILVISGFPFGSLRTKCHLDVKFVEKHKVYYKGKVVVSPSQGCGEYCKFESALGLS
jgi:hypothetical protein